MFRTISLVGSALLATPLVGQETNSVFGQVSYLERVALGEGAAVLLEVMDSERRVIASQQFATNGGQVPIPFEIDIPTIENASLRAGIIDGGKVDWLGPFVALSNGPSQNVGDVLLTQTSDGLFDSTYHCGSEMIEVAFSAERAVLDTGSKRQVLVQVPAASGAKYERPSDESTSFWSQGSTALFTSNGVQYPECQLALPSAVPFKAVGPSSLWSILIENDTISIETGESGGQVLSTVASSMDETGVIHHSSVIGEKDLQAVVTRRPNRCQLADATVPYPEEVTLTLGYQTFEGWCGGDPWAFLTNQTWIVEGIGGPETGEGSPVTMVFDASGLVYGSGPCNRYNGPASITNSTLTLGPVAATMMLCSETQMQQEQELFSLFDLVAFFEIDDAGRLTLHGVNEPLLYANPTSGGLQP